LISLGLPLARHFADESRLSRGTGSFGARRRAMAAVASGIAWGARRRFVGVSKNKVEVSSTNRSLKPWGFKGGRTMAGKVDPNGVDSGRRSGCNAGIGSECKDG
jgi:hypothetical protein